MRRLKALAILATTFMPAVVAAQTFKIDNPIGARDLGELVQKIATQLSRLAIPVAAAFYIWAGFLYLTAGAKPGNIQKAKQVFLYTSIGLAVIFIGGGFVDLIRSILNLGQ